MSFASFMPRLRNFAALLRDMLWLSAVGITAGAFLLYSLYSWNRETVRGFAINELGLTGLATNESVEALTGEVRGLAEAVTRAAGEHRVVRQPPGMSYVSEPVHIGDNVILNLVLQRTTRGALCRFLGGVPLFTDQTNTAQAGERIPPIRQVSPEPTRIRVEIVPPNTLIAGRVELHVALEYKCPDEDGIVFDRTDVVPYQLLPSKD